MLEDNAGAECNYSVLFAIDGEIELCLLWLCSGLKYGNVSGLLVTFVLDFGFVQLIVDLEITSRQNLEDCISVVLEVQKIVIGLILSFDIGETFSGQKPKVVTLIFIALYQNTLSKS